MIWENKDSERRTGNTQEWEHGRVLCRKRVRRDTGRGASVGMLVKGWQRNET